MQPVSSQEVLTKEFSRYVALADVPVKGRVRVGEDFQIYPVPVGSPTTNYIDGTYPFVIEIAYLATNQPLRNEQGHILVEPWVINQQRAFERLTEVLITLTGLTLYRLHYPKPKGAWYLPLHDREPGKLPMPQWGQQGYLHPD